MGKIGIRIETILVEDSVSAVLAGGRALRLLRSRDDDLLDPQHRSLHGDVHDSSAGASAA